MMLTMQDDRTARPAGPDAEEVLLERVGQGDPEAFALLYDRVAPAVYGLARRVLVDASLAEEVTQEVFLTVWSKASSYDRARGAATTWILTITHRRAVDIVRHEQAMRDRHARTATSSVDRPADTVSEEVLDRAGARWAAQQVHAALPSLTPLQRTAIELTYFDGLTYAQAAERLSVPLPTLKTRVRDGLRRLATDVKAVHSRGVSTGAAC